MTGVRAIQDITNDDSNFWSEFSAVMGGPDGLMTYRYVGTRAEALDHDHAQGGMNLRSDFRDEHGLFASPLIILAADVVGILADAIAVPAPEQMNLTIVDDGAGVAQVLCRGELVHAGRTQLFGKAHFVDAANPERLLAIYRDASAVLAPAPDGYQWVPPGPGMPDNGSLPPIWQAFGAVAQDGEFALPELTGRLGSTSGSLHHGPTQIVLEAAVTAAARSHVGAVRLRQWHTTFTARGKTGPFVTTTTVIGSGPDTITVEADLLDSGLDRRIASATATFDRA